MIGGHDEKCDVLKLAPDGGPSLKPCNCRQTLNRPVCTGVSAAWCSICGDCVCDRESGEMNSEECPLHSRVSMHAQVDSAKVRAVGGYCKKCKQRWDCKFCPTCGQEIAPLPTCPGCGHPDHGCAPCNVYTYSRFAVSDYDNTCSCPGVIR